ncbi:MAG: hypothetical protein ACYDAD_04530 [Acidimicrobiales bacterium]
MTPYVHRVRTHCLTWTFAPWKVSRRLGELDRIEGPIDLVGDDWGAGLTYGGMGERE